MQSLPHREILAVMAADFAGYTGLMEQAELPTHQRAMQLTRDYIEPALAAHRGRMVKFTGDGFLACFASATDAVACAQAIQQCLANAASDPRATPLLMRIGLTIANAIVEPRDIYGDDVNLAARLAAVAEPGGIVVSTAVATEIPDAGLTALGELTLKNISRRVRAFAIPASTPPHFARATARPLPDNRPSIAVLPLRVQALGQEAAWFADSLTEALIHELANAGDMQVTSYAAVQAQAQAEAHALDGGKALDVQYILTGTCRRAAAGLRVTATLTETVSGHILRSFRHDLSLAECDIVQDRIAAEIASAAVAALRQHERARAQAEHPDRLTAHDLLLEAVALMAELRQPDFDRARGHLQQAIAFDPIHGLSHAYVALWHVLRILQGSDEDGEDATRFSLQALDYAPADAVVLAIHGLVLSVLQRDRNAARQFLDRATALAPGQSLPWTLSSLAHGWDNQPQAAIEHAERASSAGTTHPFQFLAEHALAAGHYAAGAHDLAVAWARRAATTNGVFIPNLALLPAALIALEQPDAAADAHDRLRAAAPAFSTLTTPLAPALRTLFQQRLRQARIRL